MASVWSGFDVVEEFDSRQEDWDSENPSVTVTLRCKMAERYYVMVDIVGNYRQFPEITPVPLYAVRGSLVLDEACKLPDATGSKYETGYDALITVTYTYLAGRFYTQINNEDWPESLYAEEHIEPSVEFLPDDHQKYAWSADPVTDPLITPDTAIKAEEGSLMPDEAPGQAFYKIDINRMVKGYPVLPLGYLEDPDNPGTFLSFPVVEWPGRVHNKDYTSDLTGLEYKAGTLLFTQPKLEYGPYMLKYTDVTNPALPVPIGYTWKITAKLTYREKGWNSSWRNTCDANKEDASDWYYMLYKGCKDTGGSGEYTVHKPFKLLDMSAFIFSEDTFPPDPWPPSAP